MATYKPLFMYVAPASIPQIVAHIQKYLEENPILSDTEAIAEAIQKYIEEHPDIIAVASVNGKTGNVVLTGNDININATSEVTIATQIANLAAMIAETGGDIDTINDSIEAIYTELDGAEGIKARLTAVETDINDSTNGIKVRLSGIEGEVNGAGGIDSRLTTVENDINAAQTGIKARVTDVETDVLSLQARITQAENNINTNESNIETINTTLSAHNNKINELETFNDLQELDVSQNGLGLTCSDNEISINYSNTKLYRTGNVFYLNLVFTNNKSLPSNGQVTVSFTFTNSYFNMLGGFGSGFSGISSHFGYVQNNTISARVVSTGTCTVRYVFFADNI